MATIKDISRYTGLALSTISKYLNGGNVKDANRKKIEDSLKVLDYQRNEAARSLKTKKSMTIGILIPNLRSHFDATIIAMVEEELTKAGYSVIICGYHQDRRIEKEKLQFLLQRRVDGLVTIPSGENHIEFQEFIKRKHPIVLIDRPIESLDVDTILVDNENSCLKITNYLIGMGHRSIGIICGDEKTYTSRERLKGYLRAHRESDVPVDLNLICYGDWSSHMGYTISKDLLKNHKNISALISCSDDMSIGVLRALSELSVDVPSDLSMICYDLLEYAEIFKPTITTIEQPIKDIGKQAAKILLKRLSENKNLYEDSKPEIFSMNTLFIERSSVSKYNN